VKIPKEQIQEIDRPEIAETYADSLGISSFDGTALRITFCISRVQEPKPPKPPQFKRYPAVRLVLSPYGAVELFNQLQQMMGAMAKMGLVNMEPGKPPEAVDKSKIN
jgi:hypothetical protein